MTEVLKRLAQDPNSALELGKAAEHLVCADLLISGYQAFLSDQGLPYDVVIDFGGRLTRVQVKAAAFSRNINSQGRNERIAYSFFARRRGKDGQSRLSEKHCDIVAFVALDIRTIAYMPIGAVGTTVQLSPPDYDFITFSGRRAWAPRINEFPVADALSGDIEMYVNRRQDFDSCTKGHVYPENKGVSKNGYAYCLECCRQNMRTKRSVIKGPSNDCA